MRAQSVALDVRASCDRYGTPSDTAPQVKPGRGTRGPWVHLGPAAPRGARGPRVHLGPAVPGCPCKAPARAGTRPVALQASQRTRE